MALLSTIVYPGGKTRAAEQILSLYPKDTKRLVSPFFGGGSLETAAARRGWRVYGSDIFKALVSYHLQVQRGPEALRKRVWDFYPPCRPVAERIRRQYYNIVDPIDRAAAFFMLNRTSFAGFTLAKTGFCEAFGSFEPSDIQRLGEWEWPRTLSIEELDFEEALENQPSIPAYLDPPYPIPNMTYGDEDDDTQAFGHERLAKCLKARTAPWVLSYNDHPFILDLYAGFKIMKPKWTYSMIPKQALIQPFCDILILNF